MQLAEADVRQYAKLDTGRETAKNLLKQFGVTDDPVLEPPDHFGGSSSVSDPQA